MTALASAMLAKAATDLASRMALVDCLLDEGREGEAEAIRGTIDPQPGEWMKPVPWFDRNGVQHRSNLPLCRWMIRRDMQEVTSIESRAEAREITRDLWDEERFLEILRQRNSIGMVLEDRDERLLGFMVYTLRKSHLELVRVGVHPDAMGTDAALVMLARLKSKLFSHRRTEIGYTGTRCPWLDLVLRDAGFASSGDEESNEGDNLRFVHYGD